MVKGINKKIKRVEAIKAIDIEGIEETGISMTQVEGEITIMRQLYQKNVVKIYNVIRKTTKYEDYISIVIEFCDGTLSEIIRNNPKGEPRYEALGYLFQMIKGVAYLHREKILHRDLKPDNVFLKKGIVKIGDFNISKEQVEGIGTRTKPSQIILTYQYSPPERITGGMIDERVDSWAIGYIYYELLEGHMAFASH